MKKTTFYFAAGCAFVLVATTLFMPFVQYSATAQQTGVRRNFIHPEALSNHPTTYTQVVTHTVGRTKTIHVSGQTAVDGAGNLIGEGDLEEQAHQVFKNLVAALEAGGATPEDVVMIRAFIVDLDSRKGGIVNRAFKEYFTHENLPASTWVGVTSLYSESFLLEVECQAIVAE